MVCGLPGRPSPIQLGLRQLSTRVLRGTIRRPALRQAPGGRRAFAPLHTPLLISLLGVVSASPLEVATGKGRSRGCCARAALGTWSARRCITRPPSPALGCSTSLPTLPCRSRAGTRSRPLGNTLFYGVDLRDENYGGDRYLTGSTVLTFYRSTDGGQTWQGPIKGSESVAEGGIAMLPSGRLLASIRFQRPLLPTDSAYMRQVAGTD